MLAGKAKSMDIRVFKAETINDLWGDYPVVFRLVLLPFVVSAVLTQRRENREFGFVHLGTKGEKIDLMNEDLVIDGNDPSGTSIAAYAPESVLLFDGRGNQVKRTLTTAIIALQTMVWCIQGANVELVVFGDHGGELPEWVWEPVQQGPKITNIRIKQFDEPQLPDD